MVDALRNGIFARRYSGTAPIANLNGPHLAKGKTPRDEEYFDVIVEGWCHEHDGFMVFGPLKNSVEGAAGH